MATIRSSGNVRGAVTILSRKAMGIAASVAKWGSFNCFQDEERPDEQTGEEH